MMATHAELVVLLETLREVTEGSAELDATVLNMIYGPYRGRSRTSKQIDTLFDPTRPMWAPVTRDLSAARTLLPPECAYALYWTHIGNARVEVHRARWGSIVKRDDTLSQSEPLALVTAFVLARIVIMEQNEALS